MGGGSVYFDINTQMRKVIASWDPSLLYKFIFIFSVIFSLFCFSAGISEHMCTHVACFSKWVNRDFTPGTCKQLRVSFTTKIELHFLKKASWRKLRKIAYKAREQGGPFVSGGSELTTSLYKVRILLLRKTLYANRPVRVGTSAGPWVLVIHQFVGIKL